MKKEKTIEEILKEREAQYGSFDNVACIAQDLKVALMPHLHLVCSDDVILEGINMILHKLARTAASKQGCKVEDTYMDIAGYALLIVRYLRKEREIKENIENVNDEDFIKTLNEKAGSIDENRKEK